MNLEKKSPLVLLKELKLLLKQKKWYEAQENNKKITIGIKKEYEATLILKPDWENAKVIEVDKIISITTPIQTNLINYGVDKFYVLAIKMDGTNFDSKILDINSNRNKSKKEVLSALQMYQSAFTSEDLSSGGKLEVQIKVFNSHFKNQSNIVYSESGKSTLPLLNKVIAKDKQIMQETGQQCYDAYMVTRVYDYYGNLIDIYQEYMGFEICYDNLYLNPNTPPNGESGETAINIGSPSSSDLPSAPEADYFNGIDSFKVRDVSWRYHDAVTWRANSKEHAVVKIKNGQRSWHSLTHVSNDDEGGWALGVMEIVDPKFKSSSMGGNTAYMEVDYQVKWQIGISFGEWTIGSSPWKTKKLWSAKTWNTNFVGQ